MLSSGERSPPGTLQDPTAPGLYSTGKLKCRPIMGTKKFLHPAATARRVRTRRAPERDYLTRLQELRRQYGAVFPRRRGEIVVADPVIAREILGNSAGRFREHSDFFHTSTGTFGPCSGPGGPAGASNRDLAEVYRSCLFAGVGSVGFLLGWSLYLLGTSGPGAEPATPPWVVRDALRLWPAAWLFGRKPAEAHQLAGVSVTPADDVLVCGYLVHRDPGHWSDPDQFRPSRWESVSGNEAYIPFGWEPHACTGADVSTRLVEALIEIITSTYLLDVTAPDARPQIAAALAPPRFTLRLGQVPGRAEGR